MTHIALFIVLTIVGCLLIFSGIKSSGRLALFLFIIGAIFLLPGIYGLFTAIL